MNFDFLKIINSIEAELNPEEIPQFIKWADSKLDSAWTKALDKLYSAVQLSLDEQLSRDLLKKEAEIYQTTMLDLISKYKKENKISSTYAFLSSLASSAGVDISKLNIAQHKNHLKEQEYCSLWDVSPVTRTLPGSHIDRGAA